MIPTFGPGWDTSTFSASPPLSCSGNGTWGWYNQQITSVANGSSIGPGFFMKLPPEIKGEFADADPGNNFGIIYPVTVHGIFALRFKQMIRLIVSTVKT